MASLALALVVVACQEGPGTSTDSAAPEPKNLSEDLKDTRQSVARLVALIPEEGAKPLQPLRAELVSLLAQHDGEQLALQMAAVRASNTGGTGVPVDSLSCFLDPLSPEIDKQVKEVKTQLAKILANYPDISAEINAGLRSALAQLDHIPAMVPSSSELNAAGVEVSRILIGFIEAFLQLPGVPPQARQTLQGAIDAEKRCMSELNRLGTIYVFRPTAEQLAAMDSAIGGLEQYGATQTGGPSITALIAALKKFRVAWAKL